MQDDSEERYDELPYPTLLHHFTHPDTLRSTAHLFGLGTAPVSRCRVLELGCGPGTNLIGMAAGLPGSEFVGVDISASHIDEARSWVQDMGLGNVRFDKRRLEDLQADEGPFDYIIAHGVYSWVPADVQDHVLRICSELLDPSGVAYVSYNTLPGWYVRRGFREMMLRHASKAKGALAEAVAARELVEFLAEANDSRKTAWALVIQAEQATIGDKPDNYLAHDHLSPCNEPVYFADFAQRAAQHGLRYLAEAEPADNWMSMYPPKIDQAIERMADSRIGREEYRDLVVGRSFRRTLLCHRDRELDEQPHYERITDFHITSRVMAEQDLPDLDPTVDQSFRGRDNTITTSDPVVKAAMWTMAMYYPEDLPFDELWDISRTQVEKAGHAIDPEHRDTLAQFLFYWMQRGGLELCMRRRPINRIPSERPRSPGLSKLQIERKASYFGNLRHEIVLVEEMELAVISLADGTRTLDDMAQALAARAQKGELRVTRNEQEVTDPDMLVEVFREEARKTLAMLARKSLLVA